MGAVSFERLALFWVGFIGLLAGGVEMARAQASPPGAVCLAVLQDGAAPPGQVVQTVFIKAAAASVYSLDLGLAYDSNTATLQSVLTGPIAGGMAAAINTNRPGVVRIGLATGSAAGGEGALLSFAFTASPGLALTITDVSVNEGGLPALIVTNTPPQLAVPGRQTIDGLTTLTVTNTAADADWPANRLTFALVSAPTGVVLDATTGRLTWTPTEDQGPSTNTIMVSVTDNGVPSLGATSSFDVVVVRALPVAGTLVIGGRVLYCPTNYPPTRPSDKSVAGTAVNLTGATNCNQVTATDGSYSLAGIPGACDYSVSLAKADDNPPANGVTTLDIALIRRHILGLVFLDSPYKLLAADVNGSKTITTVDIALIRRLILGLTNTYPVGLWRFVPADFLFADPTSPWDAPTNRWYTNLVADTMGQDYVAIKLGDVNNSWVDAGGSPQVRPGKLRPTNHTNRTNDAPGVSLQGRLSNGSEPAVKASCEAPALRFAAGRQAAGPGRRVGVPVSVTLGAR